MTLSLNQLVAITIAPVAMYAASVAALVMTQPYVPVRELAGLGSVIGIGSVALANFLKSRQGQVA